MSFNEMAGSLEATERRRLQLVGDVAHELRTPLTTLDGYLEGLEDGVIAPSAQTWHLLRAETSRLTRMVTDLSELWRAEARQLPLRVDAVDIAEVAREVGGSFSQQAQARGIDLDVPAATSSPSRIATASPRSCRTTCPMRSAMRPTGRGSRSPPKPWRASASGCQSPTRARDSRPNSSRRCSSASTGWMPRGVALRAGPGSGSRSCARLRRPWADARGRKAPVRALGRPSTSSCRPTDRRILRRAAEAARLDQVLTKVCGFLAFTSPRRRRTIPMTGPGPPPACTREASR